jgi:hypothetical protein
MEMVKVGGDQHQLLALAAGLATFFLLPLRSGRLGRRADEQTSSPAERLSDSSQSNLRESECHPSRAGGHFPYTQKYAL